MRLNALPRLVASSAERLPNGGLRIRIQRELKNYNAGNRHPNWRVTHRERQAWRNAVLCALVDGLDYRTVVTIVGEASGLPGARGGLSCRCETARCKCPVTSRRRLRIVRCVPSARQMCRDLSNRIACSKTLADSLTALGLLRDDADRWTELTVDQAVSVDSLFWTEIEITPIAQEATHAA